MIDKEVVDEVMQLANGHQSTWRGMPERYWFYRLLEEIHELYGSMCGLRDDPVELELRQVASICINWLDMRKEGVT